MVKSDTINTGRAIKLFGQMQDAVVAGKIEERDAGRAVLIISGLGDGGNKIFGSGNGKRTGS